MLFDLHLTSSETSEPTDNPKFEIGLKNRLNVIRRENCKPLLLKRHECTCHVSCEKRPARRARLYTNYSKTRNCAAKSLISVLRLLIYRGREWDRKRAEVQRKGNGRAGEGRRALTAPLSATPWKAKPISPSTIHHAN